MIKLSITQRNAKWGCSSCVIEKDKNITDVQYRQGRGKCKTHCLLSVRSTVSNIPIALGHISHGNTLSNSNRKKHILRCQHYGATRFANTHQLVEESNKM